MQSNNEKKYLISLFVIILLCFSSTSYSQYAVKWMSAGSLHNWYSEIGSEIEEGFVKRQQYGMQWPALYANQDIQAAKALWIGATNFTDQNGENYPHKVVHVGPRVTGAGEFFPMGFELIGQFEAPQVFVDYNLSEDKSVEVNKIDDNLFADRMIVNEVNTQLGITMTRKIFQFSQPYHDNYIISEYTFKNTGNVDSDTEIELPNNTLTGVYFYYQYRLAVCANTRYAIGNGTGWGMNTMNDARGDGSVNTVNDPPSENFRAQFVWHGKFPPFTRYDNIGGPIWSPAINVAAGDTVGRLGAYQFAGVVTLHADVSATDKNDDPNQPSTTSWEGSDDPLTSQNDAFNKQKMTQEYAWMSKGHKSPRHANAVEPTGLPGFLSPTGDPALGTPGGFSFTNGYGPYTLAPGDSVTIVFAEAVSGISRELATETGIKFKNGQISALQKNQVVFQSRDSLFQTFRRAIENYKSGYNIPKPPLPPKLFNVNGLGDRISLSWETYDDPGNIEGFEIYRAVGKYDSTYHLLATLDPSARTYDDVTPIRGLSYYYYIVTVGSASDNNGVGLTPAGKLRSSRYYTQTYNPAILKRQAGGSPYSAVVKGNKPAPFYIRAGVNDKLRLAIDSNDPVDITIPADSAAIDTIGINDVLVAINSALGINVADDNGYGYLWMTSPTTGTSSKIEILDIPQNAYAELGLAPGVTTGGVPTEQEALDQIRVVPNPFNISAEASLGFGDLARNRLFFFNIPGRCNIKIYSELGELINTIEHTDGSGDQYWDSLTSDGQIVVSGIYIAVIENLDTGNKKIVKFVIIR
jgi:hypothetical protein